MPVFLKIPILNSLPFVEETDFPLKPLFKKGGQYIHWEKPYIYVSKVAEISHLLLPCHQPLLSPDVSMCGLIWYVYACLVGLVYVLGHLSQCACACACDMSVM